MTYLTSGATAVSDQTDATIDSPSITVSGSNKVLYVFVGDSAGTPLDPSGVVWDPTGVNETLTKLDTQDFGTVANCSIWRKIAPSDATAVVRVTWAANKDEQGIIAWVETGLDQTTPNGTIAKATGAGTTTVSAGAVTTTNGQRLLQFGQFLDTSPNARTYDSPTGTERHDLAMTPSNYDGIAAQEQTASGSSTTPTWTMSSAADGWGSFAFALNEASTQSQAPRSMHQFRMRTAA